MQTRMQILICFKFTSQLFLKMKPDAHCFLRFLLTKEITEQDRNNCLLLCICEHKTLFNQWKSKKKLIRKYHGY
jgi:hypothetical protein